MPRLAPDGRHLAVVTDLGDSNFALSVFHIADNVQTTQLRLPRYQIPVQVAWVDNERLIVGKGRVQGSIEKPIPTGDIVASDYDGKNQIYVYGPERSTRTSGLLRAAQSATPACTIRR